MSELIASQKHFAASLVPFFTWLHGKGYDVTLGEAYRPPEMAAIYAKEGRGIANSLHTQRLAIDLNIFDCMGKFLVDLADLEIVGAYWESLSTAEYTHCWGGRFAKPDADHFSVEYQGVK